MKKLLLTVMMTAAMSAAPLDAAAPARNWQVERWPHPVFRIGQDYALRSGSAAREVVVVFGNAIIEGRVDHNVVVIFGTAQLGSTAIVEQSLIVVGGNVTAATGAILGEDLVVIGGGVDAAPGFVPGHQHIVIGSSTLGGRLEAIVPWVTRGLMWGRPIVPDVAWVWWAVFLFFLVYLVLNLIFDRPVSSCAATLSEKPLTTFVVGLLVLLLFGPVCLLLTVSVIGIVVVPFVICALFVAAVIGKVGVVRWLGAMALRLDTRENRLHALMAFVAGFAIITIAYMVPVLGIVAWTMIWVFGIGASALAFMKAYRRENPLPVKPVKPVAPPPAPPDESRPAAPIGDSLPLRPEAGASGAYQVETAPPFQPGPSSPDASGFSGGSVAAAAPSPFSASAAAAPFYVDPASRPGGAATDLLSYPHAAFAERAAAFVLDLILVMIAARILELPRDQDGGLVFLMLLSYHIGFWTWKGTTVGGIICQLRLVRIDGTRLRFVDALVRGLASIFSLAVVGLGALWILKDPDRQAWHDKIAGTYVVKVPRNYPV